MGFIFFFFSVVGRRGNSDAISVRRASRGDGRDFTCQNSATVDKTMNGPSRLAYQKLGEGG